MLTPQRIFSIFNAYQQTHALEAAIKLDLFTAVDNGARTVSTIAESCKASERGVRTLADYLVIMDLLKKEKGSYSLTEESKLFLSRKSPACLASATQFLNSEKIMGCFLNLDEVVRKGGTLLSGEGSVDPENPMWVDFARGMGPMMRPPADEIAALLGGDTTAPLKVLDVAAGHGVFGIALAKRFPNAEVTALDWKSVLQVAKENASGAGVEARYRLLPGSAFDVELTEQYDVVLLTNFLHHFDPPTCEKLLKKMHAALKPGGRAVTLEFVPNDDRISPPVEAAFSLVMLASTPSGDAYTFAELQRMFSAAGFGASALHALQKSPQHVIVTKS